MRGSATCLGLALWLLTGCGGAQTPSGPARIADGSQVLVTGLGATVLVPAGYTFFDSATWLLDLSPTERVVLHVERSPEPEQGYEGAVDERIKQMDREGEAGVERDEWVKLDDLDGRMIEAIELRRRPPGALWLVVTGAEDGMYTASAAGPAAVLRQRRTEIEGFLRSLRIPRVPGK